MKCIVLDNVKIHNNYERRRKSMEGVFVGLSIILLIACSILLVNEVKKSLIEVCKQTLYYKIRQNKSITIFVVSLELIMSICNFVDYMRYAYLQDLLDSIVFLMLTVIFFLRSITKSGFYEHCIGLGDIIYKNIQVVSYDWKIYALSSENIALHLKIQKQNGNYQHITVEQIPKMDMEKVEEILEGYKVHKNIG